MADCRHHMVDDSNSHGGLMTVTHQLKFSTVLHLSIFFSVILLFVSGIGLARAQSNPYPDCLDQTKYQYSYMCPSRAAAYAGAKAAAGWYANNYRGGIAYEIGYDPVGSNTFVTYRYMANSGNHATGSRSWAVECPTGGVWDDSTHTCKVQCQAPYTEDPLNPGQCLDYDRCRARNALPGFVNQGEKPQAFTSTCLAGCTYAIESGTQVTQGATSGVIRGTFEFTGAGCSGSPPPPEPFEPPPPPEPNCFPGNDGVFICQADNGQNCYSASTGRYICWSPGETGSKTDGPITQTVNNGNQAPAPPPGSSTTGSNITTNNTYSGGSITNTSNTTINNYTTNNGSPAGTSNQGVGTSPNGGPNAGSAGSGNGNGDGNGDGNCGGEGQQACNTSTGGGSCSAPPQSSGDQILANIATQAWLLRCQGVEPGDSAAMVQAGSGADGHISAMDETPPENSGDGDDPFDGKKQIRDTGWLTGKLDPSGFLGGGSCPQVESFSVGSASFPISLGPICQLLSAISGLVLALAYFLAFRIMAA